MRARVAIGLITATLLLGLGLSCSVRRNPAKCGDGVWDPLESCDPAHPTIGAYCTEDCAWGECGDGLVTGGEECDWWGDSTCDATCRIAGCGSGQATPREICFEVLPLASVPAGPSALLVAELDGDADPELIVGSRTSPGIQILDLPALEPSRDPFTFEPVPPIPLPSGVRELFTVDVGGALDILAVTDDGGLFVISAGSGYTQASEITLSATLQTLLFADIPELATDEQSVILVHTDAPADAGHLYGAVYETEYDGGGFDAQGTLPLGLSELRVNQVADGSGSGVVLTHVVGADPTGQRLVIFEPHAPMDPGRVVHTPLTVEPLHTLPLRKREGPVDTWLIQHSGGLAHTEFTLPGGEAGTVQPWPDTEDASAIGVTQVDAAGGGPTDPGGLDDVVFTSNAGLVVVWDPGFQGLWTANQPRHVVALDEPGGALAIVDLDGNGWDDFIVAHPGGSSLTPILVRP